MEGYFLTPPSAQSGGVARPLGTVCLMAGLIVHEWLETDGGAESVVEQMRAALPDSRFFTLWNDAPGRFPPDTVTESWLARTTLRRSKALAIPAALAAWRRLPFPDADWILCSSHLFAHHARIATAGAQPPKFVYAHTPARYVWAPEIDDRGRSLAARLAARVLKPIDARRAQEPAQIAANSEFVRARIRRAWGRDSDVIYPPVAVEDFARDPLPALTEQEQQLLEALPEGFVLGASRLVAYKRLDAVIAFAEAVKSPVVIAGDGPARSALEKAARLAGVEAVFVGRPSQPLLSALFRRASVYVFLAIEDFGIMPVEAMAAGAPVIVRGVGGAAESVVDGETGAHVGELTAAAFRAAMRTATAVDPAAAVARAQTFRASRFRDELTQWVGNAA